MIFDQIENIAGPFFKSRLSLIKKLCGNRLIDILLHMPSYVVEKIYTKEVNDSHIGKIVITNIKVESIELGNDRSRKPSKVYVKNHENIIEIALFNYRTSYVKTAYPIGKSMFICGKLTKSFSGAFQFINPEKHTFSTILNDEKQIFNIYPLTNGITQNTVYSLVKSAFNAISQNHFNEWIPIDILQKYDFPSFKEALQIIHFPKEKYINEFDIPARRRLCFDEILSEQILNHIMNTAQNNSQKIYNEKLLIKKLLKILPFKLTNDQVSVIKEILADMNSEKPMMRLLQGDVGSGKTIVAIISALYAVESGFQCAILAPTEILARQHFCNIKAMIEPLGVNICILTASEKAKQKRETLANIYNGVAQIIVGTHSVITDNVEFNKLGLVIIDEQHRFGVNQRLQLIDKGASPHVLSMTATPIPRTIVMATYGDISVSEIKTKPQGRKPIITTPISISRINDLIESIRNIIKKSQKVYWICPLIEDSEKLRYTCVTNRFKSLEKIFGQNVAMLHGKMKQQEKDCIFSDFATGETKILVATTLIEVGVDVPKASVIIIENAEKFGLAQLHQLRGRVGRSDLQSYCVLLHENRISDIAHKRIDAIKASNDGFKIAEQDLILRGGGDVLGVKQSGQKTYKMFSFDDPYAQKYLPSFFEDAAKLAKTIVNSEQANLLLRIFAKDSITNVRKSF
ncbi:MAG: ATP-dependent DNA helicase RecG [Alphaproteobacteria bacterium]|nr:ATP-dependent DNA helicase RecG [Alphaproteobacteria bacterium]